MRAGLYLREPREHSPFAHHRDRSTRAAATMATPRAGRPTAAAPRTHRRTRRQGVRLATRGRASLDRPLALPWPGSSARSAPGSAPGPSHCRLREESWTAGGPLVAAAVAVCPVGDVHAGAERRVTTSASQGCMTSVPAAALARLPFERCLSEHVEEASCAMIRVLIAEPALQAFGADGTRCTKHGKEGGAACGAFRPAARPRRRRGALARRQRARRQHRPRRWIGPCGGALRLKFTHCLATCAVGDQNQNLVTALFTIGLETHTYDRTRKHTTGADSSLSSSPCVTCSSEHHAGAVLGKQRGARTSAFWQCLLHDRWLDALCRPL